MTYDTDDRSSAGTTNAFTHAPALHSWPMLACGQVLVWLTCHPSAWRNHLNRIAPDLPADFSLASLHAHHLRNRLLMQTLAYGYGLLPALTTLLFCIPLSFIHGITPLAGVGLAYGIGLGLIYGACVNTAAGMLVAWVSSLVLCAGLGQVGALWIDMLFSPWLGLVCGAASGMAAWATRNIYQTDVRANTTLRNLTGFVSGFLMSVLAVGAVAALFIFGDQWAQDAGGLSGLGQRIAPALLAGLLIFLCVAWRIANLKRGAACGLLVFAATVACTGALGVEFGLFQGGALMLTSFTCLALLAHTVAFTLPFVLAERIVGARLAGGIAALGSLVVFWLINGGTSLFDEGLNASVATALILLSLTMNVWRPILMYPFEWVWNLILFRDDVQTELRAEHSRLRYNAAFWDEAQRLPLQGLDQHLLWLQERNSQATAQALNHLQQMPQRWAAQSFRTEQEIRRLAGCQTLDDIAQVTLSQQVSALAGQGFTDLIFHRLYEMSADARVALAQSSNYNSRLVLHGIADQLSQLAGELLRREERQAPRFQSVVQRWQTVLAQQLQQMELASVQRVEIPNPYIVGIPLTRHQNLFVGRADVAQRIESLLQHRDVPPLLLYGQRRMGKTSLLLNLSRLLPRRIVPLVVDLQGPVAQSVDHASFLYNLAKGIVQSASQQNLRIAPLTRPQLQSDPFTVFDDWLDDLENSLVQQGHETLVLALDEFEALDSAVSSGGRLQEEAVLGMLRHIIQFRPRLKLILAGSHEISEFRRWATYLINAQTVHLSYLKADEARQLIERPIKNFPLRYVQAALDHLMTLTRGHPYLVQLACSEIVVLKDEQLDDERYTVSQNDVEQVVTAMLERGRQFFVEIEANQLDADSNVIARILAIASKDRFQTRAALRLAVPLSDVVFDHALQHLFQRELIELRGDRIGFQVEIIRRWFSVGH